MGNDAENPKALGMVEEVKPAEPAEPEEIIEPPPGAHCPSCNGTATRKGKTILCELCDCSFRYTKEGPVVEEVGPLERRIIKLEGGSVALIPSRPEAVEAADVAEAAAEAARAAAEGQEAERKAAAQEGDNGI